MKNITTTTTFKTMLLAFSVLLTGAFNANADRSEWVDLQVKLTRDEPPVIFFKQNPEKTKDLIDAFRMHQEQNSRELEILFSKLTKEQIEKYSDAYRLVDWMESSSAYKEVMQQIEYLAIYLSEYMDDKPNTRELEQQILAQMDELRRVRLDYQNKYKSLVKSIKAQI